MPTSPLEAARDLFHQLDANARLTPPGEPIPRASMELLIDAGLLGLMVPRAVGGTELALPDIVDVYEEVSRADGSTGWCYFAADCTAAYFGAYLDDAGAETVFARRSSADGRAVRAERHSYLTRRRARYQRRLSVRERHRPCCLGGRRGPDERRGGV